MYSRWICRPKRLFENPTLADLSSVLADAKGSRGGVRRIEQRKQSGPCSLSFAQEQLWFLDQLAPGSPVYNIVDVIRFGGTFDADAMRSAMKELVRRHEVLRTAFAASHGQPMQIVLPTIDLALSELDLSAVPEQEREREWIRVVREQGRKPFDLSHAPLLRGTLVHLSPQDHQLLLTIHHIIADEWSMELIHQEVNPALRGLFSGPAVSASGAADPIRRLCLLAAGLVAGRSAAEADYHTGRKNWRGLHSFWNCRPTSHVLPCKAFVARRRSLSCRRSCWSN